MTALLEVQSLTYSTSDGKLLSKDVTFELNRGELLVISGPNGVGKTTLLQVLLGNHKYYTGSFRFFIDLHKISYLPQLQNVSFHLPVTLQDILELHSHQKEHLVESILEVGLLESKNLNLSWNTASGGERKKALITRSLLENPDILILDEPFNHLDKNTKEKVAGTLSEFIKKGDSARSIIMVSHDHQIHRKLQEAGVNIKVLELGK